MKSDFFHVLMGGEIPRTAKIQIFPRKTYFSFSTYWQHQFSTYRCSPEKTIFFSLKNMSIRFVVLPNGSAENASTTNTGILVIFLPLLLVCDVFCVRQFRIGDNWLKRYAVAAVLSSRTCSQPVSFHKNVILMDELRPLSYDSTMEKHFIYDPLNYANFQRFPSKKHIETRIYRYVYVRIWYILFFCGFPSRAPHSTIKQSAKKPNIIWVRGRPP